MTLLGLCSAKGAPGVTTLSCLVAATWPGAGAVMVVEADPAGGDLAARFGLPSTLGWQSLLAAVRRGGRATEVAPHLQVLPGGLPVLVARGSDPADSDRLPPEVGGAVEAVGRAVADGLGVVDLGRLVPGSAAQDAWLRRCDVVVLVVGDEASAALHARTHAARLAASTRIRPGVLVVGTGSYASTEVAAFAGLRSFGDVPFDPHAAAVASGASSAVRRLERSGLLAAVRRVSAAMAADTGGAHESPGAPAEVGVR